MFKLFWNLVRKHQLQESIFFYNDLHLWLDWMMVNSPSVHFLLMIWKIHFTFFATATMNYCIIWNIGCIWIFIRRRRRKIKSFPSCGPFPQWIRLLGRFGITSVAVYTSTSSRLLIGCVFGWSFLISLTTFDWEGNLYDCIVSVIYEINTSWVMWFLFWFACCFFFIFLFAFVVFCVYDKKYYYLDLGAFLVHKKYQKQ